MRRCLLIADTSSTARLPKMSVRLVAKRSFSSFGVSYDPNDEVVANGWPEGTLVNRLHSGDVQYEERPDSGIAEKKTSTKG
jgi:hypothetical protein